MCSVTAMKRPSARRAALLVALLVLALVPAHGVAGQKSLKMSADPSLTKDVLAPLRAYARFTPRPAYSLPLLPQGERQPVTAIRGTLDSYAAVLSPADEKRYRQIFSLLKQGEVDEAETLSHALDNPVLQGYVAARLYLHPRGPQRHYEELYRWLEAHADHPQASEIYARAQSLRTAEDAPPPAPQSAKTAHGSLGTLGAAQWSRNRMLALAGRVAHNQERGTPQGLWLSGLGAWKAADYEKAFDAFRVVADHDDLPDANRAAAAFWAARAAEALGRDDEEAHYLQIAAQAPRSFYGLLALSKKGEAPRFNWSAPTFGVADAAALKQDKAGGRALALFQIGDRVAAEKELRRISAKGRDGMTRALLGFATRYGMPALALQVGGHVRGKNGAYDAALYPLLPWQPRGGYASDAALVHAMARHESRFDYAARSPVGATGIMQIMPDTAEHIRAGASAQLLDPEANVALGDRYIGTLANLGGINGNLLLTIAAYNCGPGKLLQLYGRDEALRHDPLLFLESLPLSETRDYVQNVFTSYAAYRARLGKPLGALKQLAAGQWPEADVPRVKLAAR